MLEPERLEHELAHRAIDRLAGDRFDDAARNAEAGVVVAPRRFRRRDLHQVGDRRDEVLQRLLAALRTRHLPFPPGGVGQQVPHRDVTADRFVADAKLRQVLAHRRAKIELALLDEPHRRRGGERLGDRCDREDGVSGDR